MSMADWVYLEDFDVWATHANSPCYINALERKHATQLLCVDFLHLQDYELLEKSLNVADIVYFGGVESIIDDLKRMAQKAQNTIFVLTLGASGSLAFKGSRMYTQAVLPLKKVVDTTGCGDAFQAGFTACYYRNQDISEALLSGAELGRKAAMNYGGVPWS